MKKILTLFVALLICLPALSRPAFPGIIKSVQPDGSIIYLRLHGDEFCHWRTNVEGQIVEKDSDGYWRPVQNTAVLSANRLAAKSMQSARNRIYKQATRGAVGQKRGLIILVEFADVKFSVENPNQKFYDMMNKPGYDYNGATGSVRDYFYENSHGKFEPAFDVYGPVTLDHNLAYYGANNRYGNDVKAYEAVIEGCKALDDQIDFSLYDNDNDGEVDLVNMYYAGYSESEGAGDDAIWPHQWYLEVASGKKLTCDGKKIDRYACSQELTGDGSYFGGLAGIGSFCHEYSHTLGLPDLYDSDYETNGQAGGMVHFSLMASGSYNNESRTPPYFTIEERILCGWIDDSSYKEFTRSGQIVLSTVNDNIAYRTLTDKEGEYFVYECRGDNGWDAYLPAHGLIVTHLDKSDRIIDIVDLWSIRQKYTAKHLWENATTINCINENGSHPCYYLIPAADQSNLLFGFKYYSGYGYYFETKNARYIPFPGKNEVTSFAAVSWNGVVSEITLSDIAYADNKVSFNVFVPSEELDYSVIDNPGNGVYVAGDTFEFKLVESKVNAVSSVSWYYDDEPVSGTSVKLLAGPHTVEAALTLSSGETQIVTLEISVE